MSDLPPIEQRVQALATVLDEKRPGWRAEIDVERINFDSITDCVLGQLYGNYMAGLDALGKNMDNDLDWVIQNAVELPSEQRPYYETLTNAWQAYLRSNA